VTGRAAHNDPKYTAGPITPHGSARHHVRRLRSWMFVITHRWSAPGSIRSP